MLSKLTKHSKYHKVNSINIQAKINKNNENKINIVLWNIINNKCR